jgi:protein-disulfide isomerase
MANSDQPNKINNFGLALFIVALLALAWALTAIFAPANPRQALQNNTPSTAGQESDDGLYTLADQQQFEGSPLPWTTSGAANPLVTVVEFIDYTCVHCRASWPAVRQLTQLYPEQVKLVLRDRTPNVRSINLALAAHCAGEQGKFWEMHDKLFQNQDEQLGGSADSITKLAEQIKLDQQLFTICLSNRKYLDNIKNDMQQGESLGVRGTPTWFINGSKLEGEMTLAEMQNIIEPLLR